MTETLQEAIDRLGLWGEEPNSAQLQVEPHRQVAVRATVAPAPFVQYARMLPRR